MASLAALIQTAIGNVVAGSTFAIIQSLVAKGLIIKLAGSGGIMLAAAITYKPLKKKNIMPIL